MEEDSIPDEIIENPEINKLTLELFMNKTQYNKYLSKMNPEKYSVLDNEWKMIQKYKLSILTATEDLLQDRHKQISLDVNAAFDGYVRTLVRHFQQKEIENKQILVDEEVGDCEEEDELFGQTAPSYWGKERVFKRGSRRPTLNSLPFFPRKKETFDDL
jgi:hypothetical protein